MRVILEIGDNGLGFEFCVGVSLLSVLLSSEGDFVRVRSDSLG